jgi:hypothetical protein
MKQQSLLLTLFLLGFGACKKPDNTPTESNTNKPVLEFVYFKVTGGEYYNKWIKLEISEAFRASCSRYPSYISFGMSSSLSETPSANFGVAASTEGVYDVDEFASNSTIRLNIPSQGGIEAFKCTSGKVTIDHLPREDSDYVVGKFNGMFYKLFSPSDLVTITEGSFRMKRQ